MVTPETFDVPIGRIEKDSLAAVRFGVAGIVDGQPRLFAEHVTRMRARHGPTLAKATCGGHFATSG